MNSLSRVLTTISHKQPDRVPVGEWGIDHDHVSKILGRHTYWRNRKDATLALWENRRDEMVESEKTDYAELIEILDYDIIPVDLVPPKGFVHPDPPKMIADGVWQDSKGNIFKYAASNDSICPLTIPPAIHDITEEEVEKMIAEIPDYDPSQFELVDHICGKFGKEKAIVFRGINIDHFALEKFGGDESHRLMLPILNPDAVRRMMRYAIAYTDKIIAECVKRDIAIIMGGRDYGSSTGCIESPVTIRDLYMPFHKQFTANVEKFGRIPFLHCCGSVWEIMDDIVQAGYKAYQSIQASAGMDWGRLKNKYGDKLTLWAGVQCETLVQGSREDVEKEVKNALNALMPGGGFIFGSTNSVQYGANTDNYLYAIDLVRKLGTY
jgi:uroporphyrinogen decarboxylase